MSNSVFVDGQNRPFFCAAAERLHGQLSGEFRPALHEDCERYDASIKKVPRDEHGKTAAVVAGVIAKHLVSWSVTEKPTAENIRRLHPILFNRLYLIVTGRDPGDAPPVEAPTGEFDEFTNELIAAGGGAVGVEREVSTIKNS